MFHERFLRQSPCCRKRRESCKFISWCKIGCSISSDRKSKKSSVVKIIIHATEIRHRSFINAIFGSIISLRYICWKKNLIIQNWNVLSETSTASGYNIRIFILLKSVTCNCIEFMFLMNGFIVSQSVFCKIIGIQSFLYRIICKIKSTSTRRRSCWTEIIYFLVIKIGTK